MTKGFARVREGLNGLILYIKRSLKHMWSSGLDVAGCCLLSTPLPELLQLVKLDEQLHIPTMVRVVYWQLKKSYIMTPEWDRRTIRLLLLQGDCFPNHRQFLMYLLPYVADNTMRRAIAARLTNVILKDMLT
jgi:hypothetical protein